MEYIVGMESSVLPSFNFNKLLAIHVLISLNAGLNLGYGILFRYWLTWHK